MEFDIGTIIYIIITIIAIVASVAGKKKKPQGTDSEVYEEDRSESFFERLEGQFGSFLDETKSSVNQFKEEEGLNDEVLTSVPQNDLDVTRSVDYQNSSERESTAYSKFGGVYDPNRFAKSEGGRSTSKSEILDLVELDENSNPDYFEIINDFDLGTAVIFSTIINRKEY